MSRLLSDFKEAIGFIPVVFLSLLLIPFPADLAFVKETSPAQKMRAMVAYARTPELRINPLDVTLLSTLIRVVHPELRFQSAIAIYALHCVDASLPYNECDSMGSNVVYRSPIVQSALTMYEPDMARLYEKHRQIFPVRTELMSARRAITLKIARAGLQYFPSRRSDFAPLFYLANGVLFLLIATLVRWRQRIGEAIFNVTFGLAGVLAVDTVRSFKRGNIREARGAAAHAIKDAVQLSKDGVKKAKQFYEEI